MIIIACVIAAIVVAAVIFLNTRNEPVNTEAYGITEEGALLNSQNPNVLNVVFLGIDKQEDRSDVMMVISVNKTYRTVNVTSLLRDTRVEIEGHAPTKLGYAYKWGGTDLALNVINTNFNTGFDRYICFTFEELVDVVDTIDGVDVYLTSEEAELVNEMAQESGYYEGDATEGWNSLNGAQALGYSRIRAIDSEYARAGRQQVVIQAIITKVRSMSKLQYPKVAIDLLGKLKTNLSYGELLSIALIGMRSDGIVQHTIPDANYEENLFGGWVLNPDGGEEEDPVQWLWIYDLDAASLRLKRIMYDPGYYEDPDLPAAAWIWNELEDVIAGLDIDISEIDLEDEIVYVAPDPDWTVPAQEETEENTTTQAAQTESQTEAQTTQEETTEDIVETSEETTEADTESEETQTETESSAEDDTESQEDSSES